MALIRFSLDLALSGTTTVTVEVKDVNDLSQFKN